MELVARLETWARSRQVWAVFFVTAAVLFADFFLRGHILIASTDHVFNHYPNLLYGHRALRQGDLGLWNPMIFAGVDFSTSFHHHMLHPRNWPLLALPEKYVLHGVTAMVYLEFALIGCLAMAVFRRYTATAAAALLLALVAQLGGFTWFTATTLIGTHLLFSVTAAVYLQVSAADRRPVVNFLLFAICFFDILAMGHIAYIVAFGLPVIAVFVVNNWPAWRTPTLGVAGSRPWTERLPLRPWRGTTLAVAAAFACAFGMALYRIVPVIHAVMYEQMMVGNIGFSSFKNHGYFALTGFVPEVLGLFHGDAVTLGGPLDIVGRHTQFHNLLYIGIVPALLVWIGLFQGFTPRALAGCLAALALSLAPLFLIQPLSDIVFILLHPFTHDIFPRTLSTFLFLVAVWQCVRHVEEHGLDIHDARVRGFLVLAGVVLACSLALWVKVVQPRRDELGRVWTLLILAMKLSILIIIPTALWLGCRAKWTPALSRRVSHAGMALFAAAMIGAVGLAVWKGQLLTTWMTFRGIVYAGGTGLAVAAVVFAARMVCATQRPNRVRSLLLALLMAAAVVAWIVPLPDGSGPRTNLTIALAAGISMARFALLAAATLEIVTLCGSQPVFRAALVPLLGLLLTVDLVGFNKLYSHVGTMPFKKASRLYPQSMEFLDASAADAWSRAKSQPNLLQNPDLAGPGVPAGWQVGGSKAHPESSADRPRELVLVNEAADLGTIYQDLALPAPSPLVTMGVWLRCDKPGVAGLLLTGNNAGIESTRHTGSGRWEWISISFPCGGDVTSVRPHVILAGAGQVAVHAPQLAAGPSVVPQGRPTGDVHETPALRTAERGPLKFDFQQYRINHPTQFCRWQGNEVLGNIAMAYGLPTYAGVDSDVKKSLYDLLSTFDDPSLPRSRILPSGPPKDWRHRGGVIGVIDNPRLLDLLGAKYDCIGADIVERPHALPRLALFRNCDVAPDMTDMQLRMVSEAFNHTTTLLLDAMPAIAPGGHVRTVAKNDPHVAAPAELNANDPDRFVPVAFQNVSTSQVTARVALTEPRLLLLNDGWSPHWTCRCDGRELPIQRANMHFMAVALPAGSHDVTFEFRPTPVLNLARASLGIAAVWMGIALMVIVRSRRTNRTIAKHSPARTRQAA